MLNTKNSKNTPRNTEFLLAPDHHNSFAREQKTFSSTSRKITVAIEGSNGKFQNHLDFKLTAPEHGFRAPLKLSISDLKPNAWELQSDQNPRAIRTLHTYTTLNVELAATQPRNSSDQTARTSYTSNSDKIFNFPRAPQYETSTSNL